MSRPWLVVALSALPLLGLFAAPSSAPKPKPRTISFNRDVRPILSEHCYRCHGPATQDVKAGLRLDMLKSVMQDRGGYKAIEPFKPSESEVIERIHSSTEPMPPKDSGVSALSAEQKQTLRLWIEQGAKYEKHWAFIPPTKPIQPAVKDKKWLKNGIDPFILARLESAGMKPEPEADRLKLLRRASLALTGLPPSPIEQRLYEQDIAPGYYERAVDRLLDSPRYGEHQARYWLDAVRYGDTHGLHLDNERAIYPYRDWVVRVFNKDVPYDQFLLWQLAGDLLKNPTTEQLLATGYIRMNPTTNEGGAIEAEFLAKNTFDRVDTTSTVLLGLTVACARCHDHKYDPISQKDYYRLFAFFNSTTDAPFDGNLLTPGPVLRAPTPAEDEQIQDMRATLNKLEASVDLQAAKSWLATARVPMPTVGAWEFAGPFKMESFEKAFDSETEPTEWRPLKLELDKNLTLLNTETAYGYVRAKFTSEASRKLGLRIGSDDALKVWVNGNLVHSNKALRGLDTATDSFAIDLQKGENVVLFKIINASGPDGIRVGLGAPRDLRVEQVFKAQNSPNGEALLRTLYLDEGPETASATRYRTVSKNLAAFEAAIPQSLIAGELKQPRPAFVLKRGEYNLPTTRVYRGIPAELGELPKGAPRDRLGFAQWLIAKDNPLTARVFVNRIWQQHFGTGIVKTSEDFGNQGEFPSHPELLDYLAYRFANEGFSIKKLHRLIVTSAAFRQQSSLPQIKKLKDPENRLISRGPRYRLDGEVLRDQVLYASGLLVEQKGGRGFKPYQPAGLWEDLAFVESTTSKYTQDETEAIYRRSLYLFWKRTSPHPVMITFDAPMREACVVRRPRTNTPLQALVTLNEPAFFEASRVFGERIVTARSSPQDRVRYAFRWALGRDPRPQELSLLVAAASRYQSQFETDLAAAKELVSVGLAPQNPDTNLAEHAAWTLIASSIFNTDEFLTQH